MKNPLKRDPSRTTLLRRQYMNDMKRRFASVSRDIEELIVKDDAFGLITSEPLNLQQVPRQAWRFNTNANKIKAYRKWLQQQVDAKILTVDAVSGKPWTATYAESAYRKGMMRAYTQIHSAELAVSPDFYMGSQKQFLLDAFAQPVTLSKVELLYTRAFDELKGVTDAMSQQMGRILANGFIKGDGPRAIARELRKNVSKMTRQRAMVIARTETIMAHAEGQLDAFERLGVEEVGVMAEWSTAGDGLVCEECASYSGQSFTIEEARGLVPLHPNCFIDAQMPILTSKGWKGISEIEVGDLVWTHKRRFRKVTEVFNTTKRRVKVVSIYMKVWKGNKIVLTMTEEHPVLVNGNQWVMAKYLKKGMSLSFLVLQSIKPPFLYKEVDMEIIKRREKKTKRCVSLYNLSVADDESYIAKGFVVHNCRCAWIPYVESTSKKK